MAWVWIALLAADSSHEGSFADALFDGDARLAAWPAGDRPLPEAIRADAAFVDPVGPPGHLTVQLVPPGREPLYDDPGVQGLLRNVSAWAEPEAGAVTSLTRDSSHWAGFLAAGPVEVGGLGLLGPVRRGRVGAGFASARRQVLSGTQRFGGQPWPAWS